jgi:tetratricopeptide (TPR) repeat protein
MMKKTFVSKYAMFCLLGIILFFNACSNFVDIAPPENEVQAQLIFEDEASVESAVAGLYSQIMSRTLPSVNGGMSLYGGLLADELQNTSPSNNGEPFRVNGLTPDNITVRNNLWNPSYTFIYHANALIEGLDNSVNLNETFVRRVKGEVHVMRSLLYFYLTSLFGDVPITKSSEYIENAMLTRRPVQEVFDSIVEDLQQAEDLLPSNYPTNERTRPNNQVAKALLARMYSYRQQWDEAIQKVDEVLASGLYILEPDLDKVFLRDSKEAIWQICPVSTTGNTSEGRNFLPASMTVVPPFTVRKELIEAFEEADSRKNHWLAFNTNSGVRNYYPFKYKIRNEAAPYREYNMIIRLAELYLVRAEAYANTGNIADALADLNRIRERAGATLLVEANSNSNVLSTLRIVEEERRKELFAEMGHRWLDLKRTDRANDVLAEVKENWQPWAVVLPIPQAELDLNRNLFQNEGYN